MKKITAYLTLCAIDEHAVLDEKVNEAIKEGWQPLGGISVIIRGITSQPDKKECIFTQALVKYEEEKHFTHFDTD